YNQIQDSGTNLPKRRILDCEPAGACVDDPANDRTKITATGGGGGGTPGSPASSVQYNSAGTFAGDAALLWDATNKVLGLTGVAARPAGGGAVCLPRGSDLLHATLLVGGNVMLQGAGFCSVLKRDATLSSDPSFFGTPPTNCTDPCPGGSCSAGLCSGGSRA